LFRAAGEPLLKPRMTGIYQKEIGKNIFEVSVFTDYR